MEESIRFVLSETDKRMLVDLAKQDGDSSMAAMLRRLIRQEAIRRGLIQSLQGCEPPQQPQAA